MGIAAGFGTEVGAVGGVLTDPYPPDFHTLGLAGCIDRLVRPLREQGTAVRWDTPHWGIEIPADCASLLYQSAREALSNTYKYAHATHVTVRLAAVDHGIRLTVSDDGTGFDSHRAVSGRHNGYGLRLMSVAVRCAGGSVAITSSPGRGSEVAVTLPLE